MSLTELPALAIPLPFVTALLACILAARLMAGRFGGGAGQRFFTALFGVFAVQAALVGLRFGYGVDAVLPLQRVLPLAVGPLLYCGFRAFEPGFPTRRDVAIHFGPPAMVAVAGLAIPVITRGFDLVIAGSYGIYIVLLVALWRRGPDQFAGTTLNRATSLHRWLVAAAGLLAMLLVIDTLIAVDFGATGGRNAPRLVVFASLLVIAVLVAGLLLPLDPSTARSAHQIATEEDARLARRTDKLLVETRLFRDPELSLSRLARRLGVPARSLSGAINRVHGINVSQYVNQHRVGEAARLLASEGDSLPDIMAASGFLTRSNFYREFRRVHGMSPVEYRRSQVDPS